MKSNRRALRDLHPHGAPTMREASFKTESDWCRTSNVCVTRAGTTLLTFGSIASRPTVAISPPNFSAPFQLRE